MKKCYTTILISLLTFVTYAQAPHAAQLYGMTQYGGPDHKGSIFHFTPSSQTVTVDYNFQIKVKGKNPKCDIVTDNNGKYYGTTTRGGTYDFGVLFSWDSITSAYVEHYNFTGIDGNDARGAMQLYNGKFYGMTDSGGVNNVGVIYEWDIATNTYIKKYDMDNTNGGNPDGSLTLVGNLFYGFTHNGGANNVGVLFSWNPISNVYTKLYDCTTANGANPVGKLVPYNNKLYGMTNLGGTLNHGVIYEWDYSTNSYTNKHNFDSINGQHPMGFLALYNNKFYGITYEGGIYETSSPFDHYGVIFEWNPTTNVFLKKRNLGALNGNVQTSHGPFSSLTLKGNIFYGTSTEGTFYTSIFSWNPATNVFTDLYWYNNSLSYCEGSRWAPGLNAYGSLLLSGNKLLGSFANSGGESAGTITEFYPDSNQITRAVHMGASDGAYPRASLSKFGKKLVGVSYNGGRNHQGNIFEWDWDTQTFTERFEMDGYNTGIFPMSTLTLLNGKFYGFNTYGKSTYGNLWSTFSTRFLQDFFSWDPVSNIYQSHPNIIPTSSPVSFTTFNNRLVIPLPQTTLLTPPNTYSYISVLQYDPTNNTINDSVKIHGGSSFTGYQDQVSANGLTYYNGKYYGMSVGKWNPLVGFESKGTIYEWDTTLTQGVLKLDFTDSTTGSYPTGDLVLVDSVFYGLTTGVSTNIAGLFKWNPITNTVTFLSNYGGYGTPTYSNGKLYWLVGSLAQYVVEYDIVLDTSIQYSLPTYPGNTPILYEWRFNNCPNLSYPKLVEVIPNKDPILSNIPSNQSLCANQMDSVLFTIADLDLDTMQFTITSSNTSLLPVANITITNVDSVYTINYTTLNNQTGTTTITITANDGYGGSVNFSFTVNVNAAPNVSVTQSATILTANQNAATYQWIDCDNNTAIAGENNQSFTATITGNYAVEITNNNCSDTSACFAVTVNTVGIQASSINNLFYIYPNPTSSHFTVLLPAENANIIVTNTMGQELINEQAKQKTMTLQLHNSGVYFVQVKTKQGTTTQKLIVSH